MTVGATEQKVFHSLTQNCTLKMEKSQQISTENPQINVCTYFHHLATQHISLTTYIIYIENCVRIFFSAGITIHQLWTPNLSLHRAGTVIYNPLIPARRLRLMELSTVRPEMKFTVLHVNSVNYNI